MGMIIEERILYLKKDIFLQFIKKHQNYIEVSQFYSDMIKASENFEKYLLRNKIQKRTVVDLDFYLQLESFKKEIKQRISFANSKRLYLKSKSEQYMRESKEAKKNWLFNLRYDQFASDIQKKIDQTPYLSPYNANQMFIDEMTKLESTLERYRIEELSND